MEEIKKINNLDERDYVLYMALLIWNLRKEIQEHMLIANPHSNKDSNKKIWDKHFAVHLCGYDSMDILMNVIEHYFPEMYQFKGKSIKQHYEEAKKYLDAKFKSS